GVDMSDHEVNLKILLGGMLHRNIIDSAARNKLIRNLEEEEIRQVLEDNRRNNTAIGLDFRRAPAQFQYFRALIRFLNREGIFSREQDSIPFEADLDKIEQESKRLPGPVL